MKTTILLEWCGYKYEAQNRGQYWQDLGLQVWIEYFPNRDEYAIMAYEDEYQKFLSK